MNEIRKALDIIALNNYEGNISDEYFVKACEAYKVKADDFDDSYEYHIGVAKSLYDHLHGNEPDEEVCKGVIPGQTKVIDGVVYIYTATPGAKTQYDWRVFKGNNKIGRQVDDTKATSKQKYVNDLFPSDLSTLKIIKKLGGSTGAELVEDVAGNQYVMKKGSNTSDAHVKSEYLANQLYDLMGIRVPDCELYEEANGEVTLLSKFIPLTTVAGPANYDEMSKGFVVDALLANWDVYQNDNCLVDSAGRVIRVDNGGAMFYKAQGGKKNFGDDCVDFDSMQQYNPAVVANLTDQDYIDQIDAVLAKRINLVNYAREHDPTLAYKFSKRLDSLKIKKNQLEAKIAAKNRKIVPRTLKSDAEMYRELTEDELKTVWDTPQSDGYFHKIEEKTDGIGWTLVSEICKLRGFDARPEVVSETEYWDTVKQSKYQMFRGVQGRRGVAAENFVDDFKYNDTCFYGNLGVYGSGIYAHVNDGRNNKDNTKTTYKNSDAWHNALSYASGENGILSLCLHSSAKVGSVPDLVKEIENGIVVSDKAAVDAKQREIDSLNAVLTVQTEQLNNITESTENDIKGEMHWDEDTLVMHQVDIDSTDWGAVNNQGEPDYPSFDDFVKNKMFNWVKDNGGTVTEKGKGTDMYVFKLPNSKQPFIMSRFRYENNAIKRKNAFAKAYNYPVRQFADWLMSQHYNIISQKVKESLESIGDKVTQLQKEVKTSQHELDQKYRELKSLSSVANPDADIMSGIQEYVKNDTELEAVGIYAAIKGYDAIIQPNGNGGANSYMIILNRSKVIVKK